MTLQAPQYPGPKPAPRTFLYQHLNCGGPAQPSREGFLYSNCQYELCAGLLCRTAWLCWGCLYVYNTKLYLWKAGNYPYDKSHAILTPPHQSLIWPANIIYYHRSLSLSLSRIIYIPQTRKGFRFRFTSSPHLSPLHLSSPDRQRNFQSGWSAGSWLER